MRFVAFLRGMNLGRRRIKNAELCLCFEEMGFANVSAFLASGNVIFDTKKKAATLEPVIATGLERSLGYAVPTFIRSAVDVRRIAEAQPFTATQLAASAGKVHVAMLERAPSAAARKAALAQATDDDRLVVAGSELFWLPIGNLWDAELDLRTLESALGPMTLRTKRTVERIAANHLEE